MGPHPLKVAREQRGWSQAKVATMLGVSTRTVSRWETYESIPYPFYREQLCSLFDKSASELGILEPDHPTPITIPLPASTLPEDDDRRANTGADFASAQAASSHRLSRTSFKRPLLWISVLALVIIIFSLSFFLFKWKGNTSGTHMHVSEDMYTEATSGIPIYSSSMRRADNGDWSIFSSDGISCGYANNGYQITDDNSSTFLPCYADNVSMSNFTFQVRMTLSPASNDGGGVIFRHTDRSEYRLRLGADDSYDLVTPVQTLVAGTSSAINSRAGQSNLVTIIARGSDIYIYVNKQKVAYINDTSSASGTFGLFAVDFTHATTALFSDVELW